MGPLKWDELEALVKLLGDTLSFDDLDKLVYASTGDRLYNEFIGPGTPLNPAIRKVLQRLDNQGQTSTFLAYVYANRPDRKDVQQAIAKLFPEVSTFSVQRIDLSAQTAGVPQFNAPTNAVVPGLERNVRPHLAQLDVLKWQSRLMKIERQVCRVELAGNALGTGFLVGPDTVLTNWHVFEIAKKAGKVGELGCRFDYVRLPDDTVDPGQLVMLEGGESIDTSPYSAAEQTDNPESPLPTLQELDYALLRLAARIGDQQIDGTPRKWITLPKATMPLVADSPILIVQHPEGSTMKLALDTQAVVGLNGNKTRLRYRTNTEPGSSGSPVFTMDWDIVALHHYGDPKWQNPLFNQGVPIELIRQRIDNGGFGSALGA
jgi:V8-like Glu-specific endopeptidase